MQIIGVRDKNLVDFLPKWFVGLIEHCHCQQIGENMRNLGAFINKSGSILHEACIGVLSNEKIPDIYFIHW